MKHRIQPIEWLKYLLFLFSVKRTHGFFVLFLFPGFYSNGQTGQPFSIGETVQLQSAVLAETRTLNIYLPYGYSADSAKTYPVIYLLDGSADEDFIHIAGLVQFLAFPWINCLPETIVVGISNVDRKRDFTFPTTVEQDLIDFPTTGHSAEFMEFIEKELVPFMDASYKTTADRTLIGQSLGGLLATEILVTKTSLFNMYFIISPSLWWDHESLLNRVSDLNLAGKSIYIAVGNEGKEMINPARELYKKLKKMGQADTRLFYDYFKDKTHADALHNAVYAGFEKMKKDIWRHVGQCGI
ncbi:MAG: alpha/beta hydrolase [Bacteroidetes bacterium]|nr:alpha/beta hydrolase [Bacteroidota bacterium]